MSNLIARLRMGTQVPEFELRQEAADEIERLTDQCIAEGRIVRKCNEEIERLESRLRDRQNALDHAIDYGHREGRIVRKCNEEIERLRHEIDVQCSSEYVERILKEIERLKAELFTMRNVFHQQDAEIERLRAVVDAADAWSCAVAMKDVWATESDLHDALNKLREAGDE